ncbi:hypothetical protein [Streptomyces sp. NPDC003480]
MAPRDDAQPSESNSDVWIDQFGVHVAVPGSRRRPGVPEARTYDPGREVEHPGSEVYFPPVRNGLDYLVSVVEHLEAGTERVSARDLKHAVLHLAAGAEVLLKARLQLEHWSLVFSDPAKARRSELEDGSLTSCGPDETVQGLQNLAGVTITGNDRKALSTLAKDLDDGADSIRPERLPLFDMLQQMRRPWGGLTWANQPHVQGNLQALARGHVPLTHDGLNQLMPW